jgi:hypothetical protein
MDLIVVWISMTSSMRIGGVGGVFCCCWLGGVYITSIVSCVDSTSSNLLYVEIFMFLLGESGVRFLLPFVCFGKWDSLSFYHGGGRIKRL